MRFQAFDRPALAGVLIAVAIAASPARAEAPLRTQTVKIAGHALRVEVADNDASRAKGLMFREKMAKNDGMLFVFAEPAYHSMWMMNTYLPLSVAFIDASGTILNILDMEPRTQETHMSAGPAHFAIETNKGWFAQKKIKAGDKVTGLPVAPR